MNSCIWKYPHYPLPANEAERLDALAQLEVLDTAGEARFDRLTQLAAQLLGMPMCAISLVDRERQFFLSHYGIDASETPRDQAFCNYVVADDAPLVVEDATADPRFQDNPLVTGELGLRFYAGVPIQNAEGITLGSLCVLDQKTHSEGIRSEHLSILKDLAAVVMNEMTARITAKRYQLECELRCEAMAELETRRREAVAEAAFKSEFLANMSHEIRTPLNGVIGMGELLSETTLGIEQQEYLNTLLSSADGLLRIINDVLDISKIEAGQMQYEAIRFCLKTEVEKVAEVLAQKAADQQIDLIVEVDPTFPSAVIGDPTRVAQILYNLAGNAIKFTEVGYVCIRLSALDDAFIRIEVEDSGIGMSAEQVETLFEKFTQADTSITRKYGGTGLGMSIVAQLVDAFDGQISVRSKIDQGTCIAVTLKLPKASDASCDTRLNGVSLEGARILVVDDIALNLKILTTVLESHGAEVITAHDGFDAIATCERILALNESLHGVVCDHHMPGLSGADVVTRIRALQPDLPILILTSGGHSQDLKAAAPDRVLHKPARAKQVIPALQALLSTPLASSEPWLATSHPTSVVSQEPLPDTHQKLEQHEPNLPFAGLSILVAEDNATNQLVITKLLNKLGCDDVRMARDGREAVAMYQSNSSCDLILMDIQMPELSGTDAQKCIRASDTERGGTLPIIALTANAIEGDRARFLADGFTGYCSKPIRRPELIAAVNACLA